MGNSKTLVLAISVSLLSACAKQATSDAILPPAGLGGAEIDVAMFKYIPDANGDEFAALWQHYEDDFAAAHKDDQLRARVGVPEEGSFYDADDIAGWMLASEDAGPEAVPRYLLPANPDAARHGKLAEDIYYPQFLDALSESVPQPSIGVPAYREAHATELVATIAGA